jgi:hypothetical protein
MDYARLLDFWLGKKCAAAELCFAAAGNAIGADNERFGSQ